MMSTEARNFDISNAGSLVQRPAGASVLPIKTGLLLGMIVLIVLSMMAPMQAAELKLPQLWSVNLETFIESAATVADLNGDGREDILVAGQEKIFALDGNGKTLWQWRTQARFMTYPAVWIRKNHSPLIYAADSRGLLTCLDGAGKVVWQFQLKGLSSWSASVVGDLDADGVPEVIQTSGKGVVRAFAALTGKELWKASVKGIPVSPAVGDLDEDGKAEVVVATGEGILNVLRNDGSLLWSQNIGGPSPSWSTAAPVIFGASDGHGRIVAASSEGKVFCFDKQGNTLWDYPTSGPVASSISVADFDKDGLVDIFVVTQLGQVYRFDENGKVIWQIDMAGRCLAAGAIVDINGDKRHEFVLCTQRGHLLVLNNRGKLVFDRQFDNRTINVTPTFGDVTPDSPGLEMVITGGESGRVFCLSTQTPTHAAAPWAAYRGDVRKSGSRIGLHLSTAVRMIPLNLAWDQLFTGDSVRFAIENPDAGDALLKATAICIRPDGERRMVTTRILGRHGELRMPMGLMVPGTYRYRWTLTDDDHRELVSGSREVVLRSFMNDKAIVRRALAALRASATAAEQTLPRSALALQREALLLGGEYKALTPRQDAVPGSDLTTRQDVLEKSAALVHHAKRFLRVADIVHLAVALGPGTSMIAFEGTVWENREVDQQLPSHVEKAVKITRRVVPGEHEPVALNLFNVTDRELRIRVHIESTDPGPTVTPHRSIGVPTSMGGQAWDPLPELDESAVVSIPSLSSRELWLDLNVGTTPPGEHKVSVRLQAINGAGVFDAGKTAQSVPAPETTVEIALHVLPFEMAPSGEIRLCTWAAPEGPQVEDLLAHGNNVFVTTPGKPQYDSQGRLVGTDTTKLDSVIERFRNQDVMLMLNGMPALHGDFGGAAYRRDLTTYLNGLVAHMERMGVDLHHFALYPIDEPGGQGWDAVNRLVAFGKMVRAVNPDIMIYIDGGGDRPMFEALAPYIDIWCPSIEMLPEASPVMEIVRKTGRMLWSYDCAYGYARPIGTNIKSINLVAQFRTAAIFAFRHNTTGIGYWCYNIGGDPWTRIKDEYPLVYPGRSKPVTSRRWEAVREGIEDFRILAALRKRLHAAESSPADQAVRDKIRNLLKVRLPALVDPGYNEMKLGFPRDAIDRSSNDATLGVFRTEMLNCVEAVAAGHPPKPPKETK